MFGRGLCRACAEEEQALRAEARAEYEALAEQLASGEAEPKAIAERVSELLGQADLSARTVERLNDQAFRGFAGLALADDQLDAEEEAYLVEVGSLMNIDQEAFESRHADILERLVVARVNDGRLPVVDEPTIMPSGDETIHLETPAAILESVTTKERIGGGYHGLSIPLGKGFRYHVGGARGRVSTRTEIQTTDAGVLSVTSKRVIFTGNRTTLEIPYRRLVRLQLFDDAIQFHMTGRKSAPLIQVEPVHAAASTIGAAKARS